MSEQQQAPTGREVVNYDDIWDYEPRQTSIGNTPLGDRGIPRAPALYALGLFVLLVLLAKLPFWPVHWIPVTGLRLIASAAIAAGLAWWAWQVPPGGVRPHKAAGAIARGLLSPSVLHGWAEAPGEISHMRPAPLPIEPDFSGPVWPRARFTGPGAVVRVGGATQITPAATRRGPKRIYEQGQGQRPKPQVVQVPAGVSIEFAPASSTRSIR